MFKTPKELDLRDLVTRAQSYINQGKPESASKLFRAAITKHPDSSLLKLHAALHFMKLGNLAFAWDLAESVLRRDSKHLDAIKCSALILMQKGRHTQALAYWKRALLLAPNDMEVLANQAMSFFQAGLYEEAENAYQKTFSLHRADEMVAYNYGLLLMAMKRHSDALKIFEKIFHSPSLERFDLLTNMAACHMDEGSTERASPLVKDIFEIIYKRTYAEEMPAWVGKMLKCFVFLITIPPIFDSKDHFQSLEREVNRRLLELADLINTNQPHIPQYRTLWLSVLLRVSNFHLAYFQKNDVSWNRAFSEISRSLLNIPSEPLTYFGGNRPDQTKSIKVLVVSQYFGLHASKWIVDLLRSVNQPIDLTFHFLNSDFDGQWVADIKNQFKYLEIEINESSLLSYIGDTQAQQYDWCMFPDVGMTPVSRLLSNFRLAKKQLVHWAHPVTTGNNAVDYFLSSEMMEPKSGSIEERYTETVIPMPGFGLWLPKKTWSVATTKASDLRDRRMNSSARIKVCTIQSLWKYLPQHDGMWVNLVKELPENFYLSFLMLDGAESNRRFKARITDAFQLDYPEGLARLEFTPRMSREDYLAHLEGSFFNIDSYGWSGGNTFLDACDLLLPTLTCESGLMRGNHSAAGLRTIGLPALISADPFNYGNRISELFRNPTEYERILEAIGVGRESLIEDPEVSRAFSCFLSDQ